MKTQNTQQKPVTLEEVWHLVREIVIERKKEAEERKKEAEERKKEAEERKKEAEEKRKEAVEREEERKKYVAERNKYAAKREEEAAKREEERKKYAAEREKANKELDKRFNALYTLFNSQWSKLVESLVEGKLVELLQARGVEVTNTFTRATGFYWLEEEGVRKRQDREIDIIAANGKEVVPVEVKTTLKPNDVKYFIETLKIFKQLFSRYKNETVYGAMAYLKSEAEAHIFAEKQGLFVIRATGDSASITNKPSFKPKVF